MRWTSAWTVNWIRECGQHGPLGLTGVLSRLGSLLLEGLLTHHMDFHYMLLDLLFGRQFQIAYITVEFVAHVLAADVLIQISLEVVETVAAVVGTGNGRSVICVDFGMSVQLTLG